MRIDNEFRQVILEMHLISYGTTMRWNPSGGGESENPVPPGDSNPMHDTWQHRWITATPTNRPTVLAAAREALAAYKVAAASTVEPEKPHERRARILSKNGWSAREVAKWMQGSVREVHRARVEAGLDPELGKELPVMVDRRERVVALAARRCSVRQIEAQTGVPRSTVQRILKEAA